MTIVRAKSMCELTYKIYKKEGWVRKAGESKTRRIMSAYHVVMDQVAGCFLATKKEPG